ncbi:MAG: radical SAM protein [Prevotella sp.]|nr:radical SAM protein [Prevotella sp.]
MVKEKHYFRPEWTCGRYDRAHGAAIMYNLLEGMSFYYEDVSAEVVGSILSVERNSAFTLGGLSKQTDVREDCLDPFLGELERYGLLTRKVPSQEEIAERRSLLKAERRQQVADSINALHEMTIVGNASAERAYSERVGGLTSVMLELTYRCSERCMHCYNPGAARNNNETSKRGMRKELTLDDYKKLLDELVGMGITKVCLTGGDPFSKNIVWDIMDYLYRKEIAVDIFTNGISVVGDVGRLAAYYPRTIGISLYSDVPEVHDSITRVRGSHDKIVAFIAECSDYALPMLLKCCIMKPNVSTYHTVKTVARRYGALPQFDLNVTDSVEGDRSPSKFLRLEHEQLEIVLRDKDLSYYISGDGVKEMVRHEGGIMCDAGLNTLCITPEGNVQPCCAFPLKLGNVRETSVSDLLNGNKELKWWRRRTLGDCADCYKHPYCAYCEMCVGNNYIAHGNPLVASENNCFLAKERYGLAVKMQEGYDPLQGKDLETALSEIKCEIRKFGRTPSVNHREDARINGVSENYSCNLQNT